MKTIRQFSLLLFAAAVFASCNKVSYRKTPGGMPYQLFQGAGTKKIYAGNIVKYNVTYKINDSVVFSSFGKLPTYIPVSGEVQPYDISELWLKLKVGDSVITTQMMDTFMKHSPNPLPPQFKKGDRVYTIIKVLDVFTSDSAVNVDEIKERKQFMATETSFWEKYLAEKKIKAEKTPSGAFVQIIKPGTGNLIDSGKYVSVNYTGTLLSGKKFDSNTDSAFHHVKPYPFTVSARQMIQGFDEAVRLMRLGSTARVYVPSMLGYGANPDPRSGIKPFDPLIFDIEIVDVKDSAPVEKTMRPLKIDTTQHKK